MDVLNGNVNIFNSYTSRKPTNSDRQGADITMYYT